MQESVEKPIVDIGDWVEAGFIGEVEGVAVTVKKRLIVIGIFRKYDSYLVPNYRYHFMYQMAEYWSNANGGFGRIYNFKEGQFTPLDPLHNQLLKTNQENK
jgi:hypothetical protein